MRRDDPVYLIWDYLLKSEKVNGNEFLKKCIDYRFKEFPKKRGEQKMFLSSAISLYIFSDRLNWEEDWMGVSGTLSEKIEGYLAIPSYAIDMHTKKGREMGKNKSDFANEGSLVVDEDKEYYSEEYRQFYHKCKYEESGLKKKRVVKEKKEKVVKEKVVNEKKEIL